MNESDVLDVLEALNVSRAVIQSDWEDWKHDHLPRWQWDARPEDLPNNEYSSAIIKSLLAISIVKGWMKP